MWNLKVKYRWQAKWTIYNINNNYTSKTYIITCTILSSDLLQHSTYVAQLLCLDSFTALFRLNASESRDLCLQCSDALYQIIDFDTASIEYQVRK